MTPRFTVEERAARFQRRYTGPWKTAVHEIGVIEITHRYRRRPRTEFIELNVAGHDLWTHVVGRELVLPFVRRLSQWLPR